MKLKNNKKINILAGIVCGLAILISGCKTDTKELNREKAKELVNVSVELIAAKNFDLAEKKLMDALRYDPEQAVAYCNLAVVDLNKRDIEASLENLETCFMKEPSYIDLVKQDPDYKVLWDDRRFKAIINRYK